MDELFAEIRAERAYQDKLWGGEGFDNGHKEADWQKWIKEYSQGEGRAEGRDFRTRMVKTAALAVAAIQAHDRNAAKGG